MKTIQQTSMCAVLDNLGPKSCHLVVVCFVFFFQAIIQERKGSLSLAYTKYQELKQKYSSYQVFLKRCMSCAETFHTIMYVLPLKFKFNLFIQKFKFNLLKLEPVLASNFLFPLKVLLKFHIAFLGLTQSTGRVSKMNHHV